MPKQSELPVVGRKEIPEIEKAAERLRELRAKRQAIAEEEEKAQAELRDLLKLHKIRKYVFGSYDGEGNAIVLDALREKPEERAYVRKHKEPKAEGEDKAEENGE